LKKIVLGGGCFWGVEAFFKRRKGVISTEVGYANGRGENPTYEEVCSGKTGYAEVVFVKYDENIISLEKILSYFWKIINPVLLNRQGNDIGTQYRTGIYYLDSMDLTVIKKSLEEEGEKYKDPIVTEIKPLENFYPAEEYHQNYLGKNPNGYCHIPLDL